MKKAIQVDKTHRRYTVCIIYFQILWCMVLIFYPLTILSCTHCLSDKNKQRKSLGSLLFNISATNVNNILDEYGGSHTQMAWSPHESRAAPWLSYSPASPHEGLDSIPVQSMWALWWARWHWNRLYSQLLHFPASIIPPMLHTHSLIYYWKYIILAIDTIIK